MKHLLRVIDRVVEACGRTFRWLSVAVVVIVTYEVVLRYAFNKPSMWPFDVSCMMGATIAAIGLSYAHLHRRHVKVDLFYNRLSDRGKCVIEVIGHLVVFLPWAIMLVVVSTAWAVESWATGEEMILTGWYPPLGPLRSVIAIAFILLLLQGIAHLVRDAYFLVKGKAYD